MNTWIEFRFMIYLFVNIMIPSRGFHSVLYNLKFDCSLSCLFKPKHRKHQKPTLMALCDRPSEVPLITHWGRVTHICVSKLTIIGSDNGLSPGRRQAIIRTKAGILSIGPLGTNISEILIGIETFSFKKMHLKMSSAKWRPFVSASMR